MTSSAFGKRFQHKKAIVDAVQFDPEKPWPDLLISWSTQSHRPRDCSFGFVNTEQGRIHVQAYDWILTDQAGRITVCSASDFESQYEIMRSNR